MFRCSTFASNAWALLCHRANCWSHSYETAVKVIQDTIIAFLNSQPRVEDFGLLFMSTCAGGRLIWKARVRSESFRRHFCKTSLAELNRTLVWPQLDWNSKSTSSVDFSVRLLSTQAVGSTTKASAFACRICVNQSFLSSWEEQHNKNVRSVILGDTECLTILRQYLVCLSGNSSIYNDMSLKNMTSLGAFSKDSSLVW